MSKLSEKNGVEAPIYEWLGKMGCERILSEDLSHGAEYFGIRIENPFL